jgi:AraC-like DNA-binding protein
MKAYLRHRIHNVVDIRELIVLEYLDFEGKYRNYEETHDFWELCYIVRGQITVFLDDSPTELATGQLMLLPPNRKHSFLSKNGNESSAFVVCFDSFSQVLLPISASVFSLNDRLSRCMETIIEESSATFHVGEKGLLDVTAAPLFGGQQAILSQLAYLMICLARQMSDAKNAGIVFFRDENFHANLANVILRFLRKNIYEKLTLDDICKRFNYSKAFLCKTFKQQMNETLIGCLNRLKIEEAKRLLTETDRSVTDIATCLGFQEVKYFDAVFKKSTGTTPVKYRNKENRHEN